LDVSLETSILLVVRSSQVESEVFWYELEGVHLGIDFSVGEFDVDQGSSLSDGIGHVDIEPLSDFSGNFNFHMGGGIIFVAGITVVIGGEVDFLDVVFG
jgi:hypothetical protein